MRVLYMSQGFSAHDHRFLTALAQTQYQIYFLPLKQKISAPLPDNIIPVSIETNHVLENFKKLIEDISPDLIHAGPIQTVAQYPAQLIFENLISMSWGYDLLQDADQTEASRQLTQSVLQASKLLICDCQTSVRKAIHFGFPKEKIVTFPWGVDLTHFSPGKEPFFRKKLGWDDCFVFLSTRSWEPIYGVELIAEAFVEIANQFPKSRLLMAGSGSKQTEIKAIFSSHQLLDKVYFTGQVALTELPQLYASANLYLSASHVDGSSVSLMEALACGLPVLVSDIPGNQEWIESGKQGWLFKDNDVVDLVAKMKEVLLASEQNSEMNIAARKIAEQKANWQQNFSLLLDAYRRVIA